MTPQSSEWLDSYFSQARTSLKLAYPDNDPKIDELHIANVTLKGLSLYEAFLKQAILDKLKEAQVEAQTNAVAWVIRRIDETHFHFSTPEEDKTYKGIKNLLRDNYKLAIGVDPAPSYPVRAELLVPHHQTEGEQDG